PRFHRNFVWPVGGGRMRGCEPPEPSCCCLRRSFVSPQLTASPRTGSRCTTPSASASVAPPPSSRPSCCGPRSDWRGGGAAPEFPSPLPPEHAVLKRLRFAPRRAVRLPDRPQQRKPVAQ